MISEDIINRIDEIEKELGKELSNVEKINLKIELLRGERVSVVEYTYESMDGFHNFVNRKAKAIHVGKELNGSHIHSMRITSPYDYWGCMPYAWQLFREMPSPVISKNESYYICSFDSSKCLPLKKFESASEAICDAFIRWKENDN